ncbi:cation:proton antiporter [Ferrovibrio sp.]|uniref:cation:proton antiporter n=1 Tax=Ferrovibrio sp. TaxID=1917215 RepID=UPI00311DF1FE
MSDAELARLFLSLAVLLSAGLLGGHLFEALRLPRVIGEICGGLLLGPSVFGRLLPEEAQALFAGFASQPAILAAFYWLGLVLLMFTAGFNIRSRLDPADARLAVSLVVGGLALPGLLGWLMAAGFPAAAGANPLAFSIVIAIGTAVTSLPVISRIFIDLGLMQSRFARVVLSAAMIQDLILWAALSVALALQQGGTVHPLDLGWKIVLSVGFSAVALLVVPSLLRYVGSRTVRKFTEASLTGYTLLVCLVLVVLAGLLGVNLLFGALLAGVVIGRFTAENFEPVKRRIQVVAIWFFVPIYFVQVGQQIDLPAQFDLSMIVTFLLISSAVKIGSVLLLARYGGASWLRSFDYGMAMNTRGGPGIVLASVALAAGIIPGSMFLTLVAASILTSLVTSMWFRWRMQHDMSLAV